MSLDTNLPNIPSSSPPPPSTAATKKTTEEITYHTPQKEASNLDIAGRALAAAIPIIHRKIDQSINTRRWSNYDGMVDYNLHQHPEEVTVAKKGDEAVGYVVSKPRSDKVHYISHIAVAPDLQKQGVGKQLMIRAMEKARKLGAEVVHLNFRATTPGLKEFYMRIGTHINATYQITSAGSYGSGEPALSIRYFLNVPPKDLSQ